MPLLKPFRGIQINRTHLLSRGLVGCWLMNEGGGLNVSDLSCNNRAGSLAGDVSWGSGKSGPALQFAGAAAGRMVIPPTHTNYLTFLVWFMRPSSTFGAEMPLCSDLVSTVLEWQVFGNSGQSTVRCRVDTTGGFTAFNSSAFVVANKWHCLVVTFDGTTIKIYVDGVLNASQVHSQPGIIKTTGYNRYFGVYSNLTSPFAGLMDNAAIWNRALSAAEIAQLYCDPFCMFERKVSPGLLLAPAGQIVSLAGTCAAGANVTESLKVTYRCAGALAAQAQMYGCLTVVGQVPPGEQWFTASLNIEQDWLLAALFGGMTANAFKLGMALTLGWFWMRRSGCSVLYRGPTIDQIDFTNALTVAEQDAGQISPPLYVAHGSNSTYFYAVRRFNTCGYRERTLAAVAKVAIDAQGNLTAPQPNNIFAAAAKQVDGNKIQLTWFYCLLQQESEPVCFRIYHDAASGQIDYQNPIGTISYQGQRFYSYLTEPLAGGRYLFAVRAEDADGVQNGSLARSIIQLVTEIPEAIDILSAESV